MKTLLILLVGMFVFVNITSASHIINDVVTVRSDWVWADLTVNTELEKEKMLLREIAQTVRTLIENQGIDVSINAMITAPPRTHAFSEAAFLFIIENCGVLFHASIGVFNPKIANVCEAKNTTTLAAGLAKIKHDTITEFTYNMDYTKSIATQGRLVPVRYSHRMYAVAYTFEKYTMVYTTTIKIEFGIPNPQLFNPKRFAPKTKNVNELDDRIYRIKI